MISINWTPEECFWQMSFTIIVASSSAASARKRPIFPFRVGTSRQMVQIIVRLSAGWWKPACRPAMTIMPAKVHKTIRAQIRPQGCWSPHPSRQQVSPGKDYWLKFFITLFSHHPPGWWPLVRPSFRPTHPLFVPAASAAAAVVDSVDGVAWTVREESPD